ncbi:hypothetical protein ACEPAH_3157 [Sanghuangporus vaninii]
MNLREFGISQDVVDRLKDLDLSGNIYDQKKIGGKGMFSDVSIGFLRQPNSQMRKKVAIKHIRFHLGSDIKQLFEKEIYIWSKLKHDNVALLLGYAFDDLGYPSLISEWMERGSAWKFVTENKDYDVFDLIVGIAKGLNYLHKMDAIHSDIKGENVLVSDSIPPKAIICDFGSSRIIEASLELGRPSSRDKGTVRWLAYELVAGSDTHSKETDVWAFGMTIYELLTRKIPYYQYKIEKQVPNIISRGKLPPLDIPDLERPSSTLLKKVCEECWNLNPEERITMHEALKMLCPDEHTEDHLERNGTTNLHDGRGSPALHVKLDHDVRVYNHEEVRCARFTADGALVAVAFDRFVRLYDAQSAQFNSELDHGFAGIAANRVQNLACNHDPDVLVTSASDRTVRVWSIFRSEILDSFPKANDEILSLACAPSGRFVVYSLLDGSSRIRDTYSRLERTLLCGGPQAAAISLAVSPDSQTIATGGRDSIVRIWDERTMLLTRRLDGLSGPVKSLVFSPSGKRIVGCGGNSIKKWHVTADSIPPVDFTGHSVKVTSIALGKDAKWVASSSKDGSARIWTLKYGQLVRVLTEHNDQVISVDFNPKGGMFATASRSEVKLWSYYA